MNGVIFQIHTSIKVYYKFQRELLQTPKIEIESNGTIRENTRRLIPHFKKGNKLYFHLSELLLWIKKGKVKTNEEIECDAVTYRLNKKDA